MAVDNAFTAIVFIALLISLGINVQPEDTHYCEARQITYHCDAFSQYYGLPNGKCIHEILPNKLCRSGWISISRDPPYSTMPKQRSFVCDQEGCEELI